MLTVSGFQLKSGNDLSSKARRLTIDIKFLWETGFSQTLASPTSGSQTKACGYKNHHLTATWD
jgi:hypothetical protein